MSSGQPELQRSVGRGSVELAREVGGAGPGMSSAHEARMSRLKRARSITDDEAAEGNVKSSRSSMSSGQGSKGQLSESLSCGGC